MELRVTEKHKLAKVVPMITFCALLHFPFEFDVFCLLVKYKIQDPLQEGSCIQPSMLYSRSFSFVLLVPDSVT